MGCRCNSRKTFSILRYLSLFLLLLVYLLQGGCRCSEMAACRLLSENKMVLVEGRERFLIGLYENPKDDARLKEAVEAGFNLIQCGADKKQLDRVHKMGAKVWINLHKNLDLSGDKEKRKNKLLKIVNEFKDHRALLIWEGPDEALWNNWWGPYSYLESSELGKMNSIVQQRQDLQPLYNRLIDLKSRGLWAEFDIARKEFWKQAGKDMPRPDLRFAEIPDKVRQTGDGLTEGVKTVRQADPDHIIWFNHAPRNSIADLTFYNRAVDMAGCDIYPIMPQAGHSDLPNTLASCVGAYTDRMRRAAKNKSCAMVLQGFGWWDWLPFREGKNNTPETGRRPTFAESRFMAYDAIIHGANAIMYWGTNYVKDKNNDGKETLDTQFWRDLLNVVRELKALEPALVADSVQPGPRLKLEKNLGSAEEENLPLMLKQTGDNYVLIVVNETHYGLPFTVSGLPSEMEGKKLYRLNSSETVTVNDGSFSDGITPFNAYVYATSRRFETPRSRSIRIVIVGDSTVASYPHPPPDRPDLTGWGQVIGEFFSDCVTILNHARSGRSSKSFIREGLWKPALAEKPDYVFIQFGHNDCPGKKDRSTDPETDFQDYLRQYVDDARKTGACPVLITPMTRRKFRNGRIRSTLRPYAEAILKVGKEKQVPVVDLHAASVKMFNRLGDEGSADLSASQDDQTHFSRKGALAIAELIVGKLPQVAPSLKIHLKSASPMAPDPVERAIELAKPK